MKFSTAVDKLVSLSHGDNRHS